jgi:hypothetical protein
VNENDRTRSTADEDRMVEAAALGHLLALHPTTLAFGDLARELEDGDAFAGTDAIERAVRDLAAAGLVHRAGDLVLPTRAALRFQELIGE